MFEIDQTMVGYDKIYNQMSKLRKLLKNNYQII